MRYTKSSFELLKEMLGGRLTKKACLLWPRTPAKNGYGQLSYAGKHYCAHALAYELTYGPVPPGKQVCHTCDVRACFNPHHLWAGTGSENQFDSSHKGRHTNGFKPGELNAMHTLTAKDVLTIRSKYVPKKNGRQLAEKYTISLSTVCKIADRKRWKTI